MLTVLVPASLAVVATLLGAIVSGRFQERAAERQIRVTHGQTIRRDRLEAVTALACAASDHCTAMWRRGDATLAGAGTERIEVLRSESHTTRSAITRPLVALRVLIEDHAVRAAADQMVTLAYALRGAYASTEDLTAAREAAKDAHDTFVNTAAHYLRPASTRPTSEQESPR
ncbi:hypothetical protein ACIPMU_35360 [Streptomyces cyaneofuscatus]|uniref:hypothetical protein n=1 Tax=Streptomyces cyaneofuscatus TaxID=66883 RepID=UPI0038063C34